MANGFLPITINQSINYNLIMQNKPNFRKAQMNLNFYSTKDYENEIAFRLRKYKPNQSQFLYQKNRSSFIMP